MHGGMRKRDRSVGWRTGSTRVPLTGETTDGDQGSLRWRAIRTGAAGTFGRGRALFAAMHRLLAIHPGKLRNYAVLALVLTIAAGCATVPDADEDIAAASAASAASSGRPTILGADGPLSVA